MKQLPPPDDEKQFELIVRDVCQDVFHNPSFHLYGKRGEGQHGIDGFCLIDNEIIAFQCKQKDVLHKTESVILEKLKKEMEEEAKKAFQFYHTKHHIRKYIFASTFKNTRHLQDLANALSQELNFPIEYWGWETISEHVQRSEELLKRYYPEFIFQDSSVIKDCVWHITQSEIQDNVVHDKNRLLDIALDYYKINDNERLVFQIICNYLDVPNTPVIQKAKDLIDNAESQCAIWIVGQGGTGKTSLLLRLAKEYAAIGKSTFFLNFENHHLTHDKVPEILEHIKSMTNTGKAYVFIDNPAYDQEILEFLLKDIVHYAFDFVIVITERGVRLNIMKDEHVQYAIQGQTPVDPLKLIHTKAYREKVYRKLYDLIGSNDQDVWRIIHDIGVKPNVAFVNATYRILYELHEKRYIEYVFDWDEFKKMARDRFPSFEKGFRYIALFYLFEIKTPLSLLIKLCKPSNNEVDRFVDSFGHGVREPLIMNKYEKDLFNPTYFYRTKHEIISELYFEDEGKLVDKNQLVADVIRVFDETDILETQTIINLFGNKRYLKTRFLDFNKLIDLIFSDSIINKLKNNYKLYETCYLCKYWLFLNSGDIISAIAYLENAQNIFPERLHYRTELAKIYQHQNKYDEAEKVLNDLLDIDKRNLQARTELAKIYQHQNKYDEAEKVLLKCIGISPKDLNSRTELAKVYQYQNKYIEAEKVLLKCIEINPKDLNSRTELAKIYQQQNRYDQAEKVLLELLVLEDKSLHGRTELAKIYQQQNRYDQAEKVLLKCIEINPRDLNSRTELAKIYQQQNKYDQAEKILLKCIEINPKDLNSRTELAKIYQHQNKYIEAEKVLMDLLDIDIKNLQARTELAKIYQHQNKYDLAEKVLMESLAIDNKQLHPRTELAKIYQHQKKYKEAEKVLMESLAIDDKQLHPRTELAKIYQIQKKYLVAEKILKELLARERGSCYAMAELISTYLCLGNVEDCLGIFDDFLANCDLSKKRRKKPQAMFNNIFKFCHRYNLPDKARRYFDQYEWLLDDRNKQLFYSLFG